MIERVHLGTQGSTRPGLLLWGVTVKSDYIEALAFACYLDLTPGTQYYQMNRRPSTVEEHERTGYKFQSELVTNSIVLEIIEPHPHGLHFELIKLRRL